MSARILVIDDEESIRFTFRAHLTQEGHEVFTSRDYESAIEIIEKKDLDLIFVDLILKGHSGIEILGKVKELGLACPVIIMTGNPSIETTTEAVRLGAFDYLLKPIHKEPLLRATKIALSHKNLSDMKRSVEEENERIINNLEAIFRSVNDGIITFTRDMKVIDANDAVEKICKLEPRELLGKNITEIKMHCSSACQNILSGTIKNQSTIRGSRIECRQAEQIHQVVSVTSSPLISRNGESIGAVMVIRDETRLNDLENELRVRHQFHNIIGKSSRMQEIYRLLTDLALQIQQSSLQVKAAQERSLLLRRSIIAAQGPLSL
jgi:PAS domain S-box-containing protein